MCTIIFQELKHGLLQNNVYCSSAREGMWEQVDRIRLAGYQPTHSLELELGLAHGSPLSLLFLRACYMHQ